MENKYIETTTTSYGQNVKNSFGGIILGLILFIASFALLWWNEGNSVRLIQKGDYISKNATEVSSNTIDRSNDTKLIATSGGVYTDETLSDSTITVAKALNLTKTVEMYQWIEIKNTESRRSSHGSTTKKTTYTYEKRWDEMEHNSDRYKRSGYNNPKFPYKSREIIANSAVMGDFKINQSQIARINDFHNIENLKPIKNYEIIDNYYYKGNNYSAPEIGDIRISYKYIPSGTNISVIGQQNYDNSISEMPTKNGSIYLQYDGIYSLDAMLNKYKKSNMLITFCLRLLGFIIMFLSMQALVNPFITIARFIPFLSEILGFVSSLVIGVIALILTLLTIAIAWFAYRPILTISLLIVIGVLIYYIKQYIQSKKC